MNSPKVKAKEAKRALNQLLSLIVGRRFAMQTDQYKHDPIKRIDECHHLIIDEFAEAVGKPPELKRVQMKMDSLRSLSTLAQLTEDHYYSKNCRPITEDHYL